ncbi:aminotransferase-like domain-containing protein [Streptomyces murinus]|uniref:aminotransferase-like domain-containing protein n=1 Tax=Streptomyces murinus TaxID=33900 RepID=UPI0021148FF0|nr:PLP-dependent aminotransferase family protein [Streptomyces murinus]
MAAADPPRGDGFGGGGFELDRSSLHPAVGDPVLGSMNFLNEVMSRFPQAVSFAPGAPFAGFFEGVSVNRYLDRYVRYLCEERGLTARQAQQLLLQYGATAGHINRLVADALRSDEGIDAPAEAVVVTVGCQEAMFVTLRALCARREDVLLVVDPCYAGIAGAARLLDVEIRTVPQGEGGFDLDELRRVHRAARAEGRNPRAFYVVPDFANPSGDRMGPQARRELLSLAEELDLLILEDNPYGFTADPDTALPTLKSMDERRRVVYLGTFAKVYVPGARVGFVVADQRVRDEDGRRHYLASDLTAIKSMITVNTSPISQAVVGGMILESGGTLAVVAREKGAFYRRNLAHLLDALERRFPPELRERAGLSWNSPQGGFFVVMTMPFETDEKLLEYSAREFGVLWTPMRHFYLGGSGGTHQLRLSCSYLVPEQIEDGVERLARLVETLI